VPTRLGTATDVPQTLVLHALEHGAVAGLVALDRALHDGAVEMSQVEAMGALVAGWPRSHRVLTMLAYADGRSESVGESRLRVHLGMAGLDVEPQVVIRDEVGDVVARVDLAVRGTRVLIEFDGLVKYREGGSEALIAEKRREDELRRLGYVVVRFTWADLYRPERVVARVRAAVAAESSPLGKMTVPSA
jgi:very-short-patch-repair endonuclease